MKSAIIFLPFALSLSIHKRTHTSELDSIFSASALSHSDSHNTPPLSLTPLTEPTELELDDAFFNEIMSDNLLDTPAVSSSSSNSSSSRGSVYFLGWTLEEDSTILEAVRHAEVTKIAVKWAALAQCLNRSKSSVVNHYKVITRQRRNLHANYFAVSSSRLPRTWPALECYVMLVNWKNSDLQSWFKGSTTTDWDELSRIVNSIERESRTSLDLLKSRQAVTSRTTETDGPGPDPKALRMALTQSTSLQNHQEIFQRASKIQKTKDERIASLVHSRTAEGHRQAMKQYLERVASIGKTGQETVLLDSDVEQEQSQQKIDDANFDILDSLLSHQ